MLFGLVPWLAETALGKAVSTSFLAKIPRGVWEALAVLGYALAIYATHVRVVHEHDAAIIAANNAQWQAKITAASAAITKNAEHLVVVANQIKETSDEEHARNAGSAQSLRLLGPGAAAPHCPAVPAAPGQSQSTPAEHGVTGPVLPQANSAAVPWSWLVTRAQEHDDLVAEDRAWRAWYQQVVALWPKG